MESIPKPKGISSFSLMSAKRYTIHDIARAAKVGVGTVSRVLNDDAGVKAATRARVREVIAEVGYKPSFTARSLRTQRSETIGLIADAVATTPFAVELIKGAQAAALEQGKLLLVFDADNAPELRERSLSSMLSRKVEGIIYAAMFHQEVVLSEAFYEAQPVLVDCFERSGRLASVVPDEVQGAYSATKVLLEAGHRRVAHITNERLSCPYPAAKKRLEGYKKALAEAGIAFDADLVAEGDGNATSGFDRTRDLMALSCPPTALFCGTDRIAMGAYDALKGLGLRIPEDVSVVGFDNQELIAAYLYPPLTTVALPHLAMGRWAVEQLLCEVSPGPVQELLPCPVRPRASVRELCDSARR